MKATRSCARPFLIVITSDRQGGRRWLRASYSDGAHEAWKERGIKTSEQCDTRDMKDTKYEFSPNEAGLGAK